MLPTHPPAEACKGAAGISGHQSRIISDYGLTDIVAQRFDAGVRDGEQVAKDMIAVRMGPDARMAVVGLVLFPKPVEPKKPQEL